MVLVMMSPSKSLLSLLMSFLMSTPTVGTVVPEWYYSDTFPFRIIEAQKLRNETGISYVWLNFKDTKQNTKGNFYAHSEKVRRAYSCRIFANSVIKMLPRLKGRSLVIKKYLFKLICKAQEGHAIKFSWNLVFSNSTGVTRHSSRTVIFRRDARNPWLSKDRKPRNRVGGGLLREASNEVDSVTFRNRNVSRGIKLQNSCKRKTC